MLPGMDGMAALDEIRKIDDDLPVLMITAFASVENAIAAMKRGAYDYITKSFKNDEVLVVLRNALAQRRLVAENRALKQEIHKKAQFEELLSNSPAMQGVFKTIAKMADFKTTALITGESGVGKELIARAIHARSTRRAQPFIAVNCGAIPETLLESELFGYKRGAFTDATTDRTGLFEQASGGTLLLDEIGELPLPLQVKLLRVLQEETIRPLGDTRDLKIDTRIIAATHRDLAAETKAGRFREDLYYRINVLPIHVPPLRERREDIPLLVDHFIARNNLRFATSLRGVDAEARKLLVQYAWPGNVRELENTIERAMVLSERDVLSAEDLPERIRDTKDPVQLQLTSGELSIKKTTRAIEEILIRRALAKTKGNRTRAAEVLEISHRALLYKIKEFGIDL